MSQDEYPDPKPQTASGRASVQTVLTLRVRFLAAVVTVLAVQILAVNSGLTDQSNTSLVLAGFDPDRAQLITSLLLGAAFAAAVATVTGRIAIGTVLGAIEAALLFSVTFYIETLYAVRSGGVDGTFDLAGWLLTVLALTTSGVISAWAGAGLGSLVRPWIVEAGSVLRHALRERQVARTKLHYPLAIALVLVLVAVTMPVLGDMMNYTPDALMRQVAALPQFDAYSLPPAPSAPGSDSQSPNSDGTPPPGPWVSWLPTGVGEVTVVNLPAPWKGGTNDTIELSVYTPPGYSQDPSRNYPVLYEAPFRYSSWDTAIKIKSELDALIDQGSIPATIAVFIGASGGPFVDTECANSFDGREWLDSFISQTAVGWVDSHYRTIASPAARSILGMSQGGYCAAILALHHPDVFGTAVSFSGYYQAGAVGLDSEAPFASNSALIAADSPTIVAAQLDVSARRGLYFVVIAKLDQPGYGPQAWEFERVLATYGYSYDALSSDLPHGWSQLQSLFPAALESWADREVAEGVF
jgi:enterochelin esterase-like enzyme